LTLEIKADKLKELQINYKSMKNKNITSIIQILTPLPLDLEKSSARRRFIRHLKGFKENFELEGEFLRQELGEKNPDGSLKVIDKVVQFTKENRKKFGEKAEELDNLDIKIDWTGEEKDKETVISLLEQEILDLKTPKKIKEEKTFTDTEIQYLEILEEIIEELK
jgi:hypothetical protein